MHRQKLKNCIGVSNFEWIAASHMPFGGKMMGSQKFHKARWLIFDISIGSTIACLSGKGCKGSTNAPEPPSAYGKGHDIETNGFGLDTVINRNANYGAKTADPSYGVSNKPIGDYQLGTNDPSRNYVTGTSRTKMAAGAEDNIWLKAGDGEEGRYFCRSFFPQNKMDYTKNKAPFFGALFAVAIGVIIVFGQQFLHMKNGCYDSEGINSIVTVVACSAHSSLHRKP